MTKAYKYDTARTYELFEAHVQIVAEKIRKGTMNAFQSCPRKKNEMERIIYKETE